MADTNAGAPTPAQALQKLRDGNAAYVAGRTGGHPIDDAARRDALATKQEPFAAVVSCSDSRVPPERLFAAGVGDLFVVRNAGNTVTEAGSLGSVQYAVAVLNVPLVVVMGHSRCGAVKAAVDAVAEHAAFPGAIGQMIEPILPSVEKVRGDTSGDPSADTVDAAVRANVRRMAETLRADPVLAPALASRKLAVVGARFDLDGGTVEFLDELTA